MAHYLYNSNENLETLYAGFKAGLVPVSTNYRYGSDEFAYLWDSSDAVAVVSHGTFAGQIEAICSRAPRVKTFLWVNDGSGPGPERAVQIEHVATSANDRCVPSWGRSDEHLLLLYTGGTTGMPKGVRWQQKDLIASLDAGTKNRLPAVATADGAAQRVSGLGLRNLPAAPPMHGTGMFNAISNLMVGGSVHPLEGRRFEVTELLDTVHAKRVNSMSSGVTWSAEDGWDVVPGSGERGRVAMRGCTPVGYYKDPEKSAATFIAIDGVRYSMSGDWGEVDANGTVRLLGRRSECINTGALIAHVKEHLAHYKAPKRVIPVASVGRAANGKLDIQGAQGTGHRTAGVTRPARQRGGPTSTGRRRRVQFMANPLLNEASFRQASGTGTLPPPDIATRVEGISSSATRTGVMTVNGAIQATLGLLVLLLAGGVVGWRLVKVREGEITSFPSWTIFLVIIGAIAVMVTSRKPQLAKVVAPAYAVAEGLFVGAISHAYETWQSGIVLAAVGATLGVFTVMLVLYRFRIIKVTNRFRSIVVSATMGLMVFYVVSLILNAFGVNLSIISSASGLGIAFSVFAAGLAAFNLLLDFDLMERGAKAGAPAYMNWFAALGLLVTIVWLYLEMLRLLSKLQRR